MFFREVVGQAHIKEKLLLSVQQNRLSHAQLFLGPEGNGSLPLALAFAQYINCENKQETDSCGACSSCIKSQKMIHPDIHYSYPVFKLKSGADHPALSSDFIRQWRESVLANAYMNLNDWLDHINAENKQGAISADECRDIINRLKLKTFESKHKVMIIWRPEFFSQGGRIGNMLLKLLEEPPDDTVIILIAENRDDLLGTIVSRCQIISIPRLSDDQMMETLIKQHGQSREAAMRIVRQIDGNYREALLRMNDEENDVSRHFKSWMQLVTVQKAEELLKWIEETSRLGREKQKLLFRYGLEFIRECMIMQQAGESFSRLHDEEQKMAKWFAGSMDSNDWHQLQQWFEESHYHIERNAHPKILFTHLSLQLQDLITAKKLLLAGSN